MSFIHQKCMDGDFDVSHANVPKAYNKSSTHTQRQSDQAVETDEALFATKAYIDMYHGCKR